MPEILIISAPKNGARDDWATLENVGNLICLYIIYDYLNSWAGFIIFLLTALFKKSETQS